MWGLIVGWALCGAVEANDPPQPDIAQLIRQLDADDLATRDNAEKKLLELGVATLNQLPAESKDQPPEVTKRLQRIRSAIESRLAETAGEPSHVTLHGKFTLAEILKEITKQTGNPLHDGFSSSDALLGQKKLSVDLDKTTFWDALDQILTAVGLRVAPFSEERGLLLVTAGKADEPPAVPKAIHGPFCVMAMQVHASRSLEHEEPGSVVYELRILWEPRLRPVAMNLPMASVKALGDGDEEVAPASKTSDPQIQVPGGVCAAEISLPLTSPPRSVAKLAKLAGDIGVLAISRFEDFKFDAFGNETNLLPRKMEKTIAGVAVAVERVQKNEEIWEVYVTAKYPANKTAMESYQNWMYENEVYLVDAAGKQIEPGGYEQTSEGENRYGVKYLFDLPSGPAGCRFVYRAPISVLELPVSFEFTDIDLP